jgi:hypothetical protein
VSGWLKKARDIATPENVSKAADAIEENLTADKIDAVLDKAPGGDALADMVPDDLNTQAADALRKNLGDKKD